MGRINFDVILFSHSKLMSWLRSKEHKHTKRINWTAQIRETCKQTRYNSICSFTGASKIRCQIGVQISVVCSTHPTIVSSSFDDCAAIWIHDGQDEKIKIVKQISGKLCSMSFS